MAETGRYMYAVSRGLDASALTDVRGLAGGRLELVADDELVAVVSDVDLDEYGEEGLRRNLENLAWLEEAARGHDAVVHAAAAAAPTAPLRLATICHDDEGVRRRLREWHHALAQVLDRIAGRQEWSVKAFASSSPTAVPSAVGADAGESESGAAYLRRKRSETDARLADETAAADAAARVHEALAQHSVASRRLPAQDPKLTGHEGTMLLNGAYLVPVEEAETFAALAGELDASTPEVILEWGGPWPPYSFAMLDQR